ncbi:sporulation related domain protein [bacterium BMS3Abin14]|nr:sporulation related domain protein [bacterium BMS3Abin14]
MGDDFDLFPKRDNLDPFSFGQDEKGPKEEDKPEEPADLVFGVKEEKAVDSLPDLDVDKLLGEPRSSDRELEPPMSGPIPDEQSGIGIPPAEGHPGTGRRAGSGKRKTSPFVLIGGALVLILLILWGVLNYLHQDRRTDSSFRAPAVNKVTVKMEKLPRNTAPKVTAPVPKPVPVPIPKPVPAPAPEPVQTPAIKPVKTPSLQNPMPVVEGAEGKYSVQVGACILKSSVRELEKKLAAVGYSPLYKKGSTHAMMHFLTVGPFASTSEAERVLSDLKQARVEANLSRVSGGETAINAGSYLFEGNARMIMTRINKMGYRVRLTKRETRLPMTFVRVGKFRTRSDAGSLSDELKDKGFDAIVVKLQ